MVGPNTAATAAARTELYLGTAQEGVVGGRPQNFYSGTATKPTSFTGNQILGVHSNGVGAGLLNGVGPVPDTLPPCDEPVIASVLVNVLANNLEVLVAYPVVPGDLYQLFTTGGTSYAPVSVEVLSPTTVRLLFIDEALMAPGTYNLKIMRASDPSNCFTIQYGIHTVADAACLLTVTAMSSPTGFPVFPPGPAGNPGGTFTINLVGTGFLSGPLTILLSNGFFPFDTISPDSQLVIDDNNLTFDFTGNGFPGTYFVGVSLTSDPTCNGSPPETIRLVAA